MNSILTPKLFPTFRFTTLMTCVCMLSFPNYVFSATANGIGAGELELSIVDAETSKPIIARMTLKSSRGRTIRPRGTVKLTDYFLVEGQILLKLAEGDYSFVIERGLEYRTVSGTFTIEKNATDNKTIELVRYVHMSEEGWWSGDLDLRRSVNDAPVVVVGEDLHAAYLTTWDNRKNEWLEKDVPEKTSALVGEDRFFHWMSGSDRRAGGGLLLLNSKQPIQLVDLPLEYPSSVDVIKKTQQASGSLIVAQSAIELDLPVWMAGGMLDSVALAPRWLERDQLRPLPPGIKTRDEKRFIGPLANAHWNQQVYYHILNCGFQLPPCGVSGFGQVKNFAGANRTYVQLDGEFSPEAWQQGLKAGRVIVTNGPMLRPLVNGEFPGHQFVSQDKSPIELEITLKLSTRDRVEYLEIVKNGRVVENVPLNQWVKANGRLPKITFEESGWMLIRAVANNEKTYRFASSAPYYVQIGDSQRVSKASAEFFLKWVYDRVKEIEIDDPAQREHVLKYHRAARDFWQNLVDTSNAK